MTTTTIPADPPDLVTAQPDVGNAIRLSWPFQVSDLRTNLASLKDSTRETLIAAFLWCVDPEHPISKSEFARSVGYSDNTIYRIYTNRYVNPETREPQPCPDELISNIKHFLAIEKDRLLGGTEKFIITPTAKKIFLACDLARESRTPVFLIGRSQIGKTWSLEKYAIDNNHGRTIYVSLKAASGVKGMLKRIAAKLAITGTFGKSELANEIAGALSKHTVLILDELHELTYTNSRDTFFSCLEVIRGIFDESKCGLVLCGTKLLMDNINSARSAELEQLMRRGVHRTNLPNMPTKEDLTAIFAASGLEFPDKRQVITIQDEEGKPVSDRPYELIRTLAKEMGLTTICEHLRYARKIASKSKQKVTWTHFVHAHYHIISSQTAAPDWE